MKKLLVVAGAAGLAVGGWKLAHRTHVDDGKVEVTDRLWIDHMPKHDRDLTHVLIALTHDHNEDNVGFLQFGSRWVGEFKGFRFDRKGDDFAVEFPQSSWKATWHTKVSRCSMGDFTLCLEITSPRGTGHYFSRDEWVIGSADAGRALEAKILHDAPPATGTEPAVPNLDEPLAP
jgi:hypothetical protein